MATRYFLDSSALLKRYVREHGSARIHALVQSGAPVILSRLAHLEVLVTIARRAKGGDISYDDALDVYAALEDECRTRFDILEVGRATMMRAMDVGRTHALKGADAVHLASALLSSSSTIARSDFVFVCADRELNRAAGKEGLTILDPNDSA